jgi:membrane fusion protein (multidrug efflux system)
VDPQPYEADLAVAESQLAEARIAKVRATNDLQRMTPLAEIKAVSERDFDATLAEKKATEELVRAAQAQAQMKKIQLGYTELRSPIDGLIGKSLAREGEFVGRSPNL